MTRPSRARHRRGPRRHRRPTPTASRASTSAAARPTSPSGWPGSTTRSTSPRSLGQDDRGRPHRRPPRAARRHGARPRATASDPTSTAVATLDEHRRRHLRVRPALEPPAPSSCPTGTGHVHTGSIGAVLEPGAASVTEALRRGARARAPSPTTPTSARDHGRPRRRARPGRGARRPQSTWSRPARTTSTCLYAGQSAPTVMARWVRLGAALVRRHPRRATASPSA